MHRLIAERSVYCCNNQLTMMHPAICRNCGYTTTGNYCEQCGQKTKIRAITLHSILHEIFHYFTHLDKGFGYTLKKLVTQPGTMQRNYLEGERSRHQKPFSMFFICGTISGLGYYFINVAYAKIYGYRNAASDDFFRHYFVILQALLLPVYTAVTWLFFKRDRYNYAETLIMTLYNLALVHLILVPNISLKLLFPNYENRILEVGFLLVYNSLTNLRFYEGEKAVIIAKTTLAIAVCYGISHLFSQLFLHLLQP